MSSLLQLFTGPKAPTRPLLSYTRTILALLSDCISAVENRPAYADSTPLMFADLSGLLESFVGVINLGDLAHEASCRWAFEWRCFCLDTDTYWVERIKDDMTQLENILELVLKKIISNGAEHRPSMEYLGSISRDIKHLGGRLHSMPNSMPYPMPNSIPYCFRDKEEQLLGGCVGVIPSYFGGCQKITLPGAQRLVHALMPKVRAVQPLQLNPSLVLDPLSRVRVNMADHIAARRYYITRVEMKTDLQSARRYYIERAGTSTDLQSARQLEATRGKVPSVDERCVPIGCDAGPFTRAGQELLRAVPNTKILPFRALQTKMGDERGIIECPYCSRPVNFQDDDDSWRRHVYSDLFPPHWALRGGSGCAKLEIPSKERLGLDSYKCTQSYCGVPGFASRDSCALHMKVNHGLYKTKSSCDGYRQPRPFECELYCGWSKPIMADATVYHEHMREHMERIAMYAFNDDETGVHGI